MLSWPREWGWVGGRWWNTREGGPDPEGIGWPLSWLKASCPHTALFIYAHVPCEVALTGSTHIPVQFFEQKPGIRHSCWSARTPCQWMCGFPRVLACFPPFHLRNVYFMYEKFTKTGRKLIKMLPTLFTNCTLVNQTPTFSNCFIQWLPFCFNFANSVF